MEIILLVGAAPYRLSAMDARWLEEAIRDACTDERGRALSVDETVWACILLANVLHEDLESASSPEPIELSWRHAKGLLTFVLRDDVVERSAELAELYDALLRFRGHST